MTSAPGQSLAPLPPSDADNKDRRASLRGDSHHTGALSAHLVQVDHMASVTCRVQYLEDSDPFVCANFPEPRRPLQIDLDQNLALSELIGGIQNLLGAPLKVSPGSADCPIRSYT